MHKLERLLQTFRFLSDAYAEYGETFDEEAVARLQQERDRAFLELLLHSSDDARVTLVQLRFL
ncbi:MAG: hypothetical protein JSS20_18440, partial [Proteobacteria bacterium]|nr:hypothetical protein [Pseudomonadota bacterium]